MSGDVGGSASSATRRGSSAEQQHLPVMLERVIALLAPALATSQPVVVDATVGLGGHAEELLRRFGEVRLIGIDRDPHALQRATARLAAYSRRVDFAHAGYDELPGVLADLDLSRVQGVLFDLGVSSLQLDQPARGFSYARDAPLDMRMDPSRGRTAADVVNTYPPQRLARVLRDYGEERFARRIADAIVRARETAPIMSTSQLVDLVRASIPAATRRTGGNPAKRTFQALRIEVNGELEALGRALPAALDALAVGGRIVVLSYHSLEDRLVKRTLVAAATSTAPPDLPVLPPEAAPQLRLLTRGGETADAAELAANPRSSSVRLRAGERLREAA
jgi:16S rRNA (cytosine1402-N4)-methyltransferase